MLRVKVLVDIKVINVIVKLFCMRNWEECFFIFKREMEIKGKYWRRVAREGLRGGRLGVVQVKWFLKNIIGGGMDKRVVENRIMNLNCLYVNVYCVLFCGFLIFS